MGNRGRPSLSERLIKIPANSGYYGLPENREETKYNNEFAGAQSNLKNLYNTANSFIITDPDNLAVYGYEHVYLLSFKERKYKEDPRLVYKVEREKLNGKEIYYLKTGLYIGYLNVAAINSNKKEYKVRLEINTGYNENLLRRMLNVANNIYLDNSSDSLKETKSDNMLSNIIGFLFLTSFKAAFAMGIPSEYKTVNEQGFNVKGRIDVKKYVQRDMFVGDKLSYSYKQREYVQDIIDVLYLAMRTLEDSKEFNINADYARYYRQLKQMRSGKKVSRETLRKIEKHRSLNNPMYSRYKKALFYARIVLDMKDVIRDEDSEKSGFSGFLLDVSQLWEIYLEKLLKNRFEKDNYVIRSQEDLDLYQNTFYHRHNYPDLVIEDQNGTVVAVIDAKFKTMKYCPDDVDRNDLFQIHSYAGYYNENNRREGQDPLKFCSLVYPAVKDPENEGKKKVQTDAPLYGLSDAETYFSVGYLKVGDDFGFKDIIESEKEFLNKIQNLLGGHYENQTDPTE